MKFIHTQYCLNTAKVGVKHQSINHSFSHVMCYLGPRSFVPYFLYMTTKVLRSYYVIALSSSFGEFLSYIMVRILFEEMLVLHVAHKQQCTCIYISLIHINLTMCQLVFALTPYF